MTALADKYFLKWNNFNQNVANTFGDLRKEADFADVTLACEDGHVEAHKLILSATCSGLSEILKKSKKHESMVIYMKGLSFRHLTSVIDFIYKGEVSVPHEELTDFLALAESLKVKGLEDVMDEDAEVMDENAEVVDDDAEVTEVVDDDAEVTEVVDDDAEVTKVKETSLDEYFINVEPRKEHFIDKTDRRLDIKQSRKRNLDATVNKLKQETESKRVKTEQDNETENDSIDETINKMKKEVEINAVNSKKDYAVEDEEENLDIDEIIVSMIERLENPLRYKCKVCGRTERSKNRTHLKNHIESIHMEGFESRCTICGGSFKTRKRLSKHMKTQHA